MVRYYTCHPISSLKIYTDKNMGSLRCGLASVDHLARSPISFMRVLNVQYVVRTIGKIILVPLSDFIC